MALIFAFSNMGAEGSDAQSTGLSKIIVDGTSEFRKNIGIFKEMPSRVDLDNVIEAINTPVRKCAHTAEYFVLTILVLWALRDKDTWNIDIKKACLIALGICFIYSLTDEFHQIFIPGRSGELKDCINDTLGGLVAVIVYITFYNIKKRLKKGH